MDIIIWFILKYYKTLPCKDNSLLIEDDSDLGDAYECRHRRRVDPAAFCQDLARYQVPYAPDRTPFVPRQRNSSQDCDPAPTCPPVSADIPCAATPIKKIHIVIKKTSKPEY